MKLKADLMYDIKKNRRSEIIFLICYSISRFSGIAIVIFTNWYVWEQTKSASILGLMSTISGLAAISGLVTGVFVDKTSKFNIIVISDFVKFLILFLLFILLKSLGFSWVFISIILLIHGIINQFYSPAMRTHMISVLGEEKIPSINGKLFVIEQLSIVGGASITGILISLLDEKFYILISLLFFISFLILSIHKKLDNYKELPKEPKEQNNNKQKMKSFFSDFQTTYSFFYHNKLLWETMPLILILFFSFTPFFVLLSMWADAVLNKGAMGYALMEIFFPVGMMVGGLITSFLTKKLDERNILTICLFLAGTMILIFSFSTILIISLIVLALIGMFISIANLVFVNIQTDAIPHDLRGRYFSTSQTFIHLTTILGYSVIGLLADKINITYIFMATGFSFFISACAIFLLPSIKAYTKKSKKRQHP